MTRVAQRLNLSTARDGLREAVLSLYKGEPKDSDIKKLLDDLVEVQHRQTAAVSVWDDEVEKIHSYLDETLTTSLQTISYRIGETIKVATELRNNEVAPLLSSKQQVADTISYIERVIKDSEACLGSFKREDVASCIKACIDAERTCTTVIQGALTKVESKFVVQVEQAGESIIQALQHLDPERCLVVKYTSSESFEKAKQLVESGNLEQGFVEMQAAASVAFAPAMMELSRMHFKGIGTSQDLDQALVWAKRAASTPNPPQEIYLLLGQILTQIGDREQAIYWLKKGADVLHPGSLGFLAINLGLSEWLCRAAECGDVESQESLAGQHVQEEDWVNAVKWYTAVAASGRIGPMFILADILDSKLGDYQAAANWYQVAAKNGHVLAQYRLACMLEEGKGVDEDKESARDWFSQAAEAGDVASQVRAGLLFEFQDVDEAMKWFKRAAASGDALAQFKYGKYLYTSAGDENQGAEFLLRAAVQSHPESMLYLGQRCKRQKDFLAAFDWFQKGAELRHPGCCFELGKLYFKGEGVPSNPVRAKELFEIAADLGLENVRILLEKEDVFKSSVKKSIQRILSSFDVSQSEPGAVILMPEPAKVSFFFKRASVTKKNKWQKRLFVLNGPFLSYFRESSDSYPVNRINVRKAVESGMTQDLTKKAEFHFHVVTKDRDFEMYSTDKKLVEEWVDAIRRASVFYQKIDTMSVFLEEEMEGKEGASKGMELEDLPMENRFSPELLSDALKSGWMMKQGGKRKNWNKRWFVLCHETLFYFKDESSRQVEGGIPLENGSVVASQHTMEISKKDTICILTLYRNFFLQAASDTEMHDWISKIRMAIEASTARKAISIDDLDGKATTLAPSSPGRSHMSSVSSIPEEAE
jgi:TPR repeat protein